MTLLDECIEVLKPNANVLPRNQNSAYARLISDNFPIQLGGSIDWDNVDNKIAVHNYSEIQSHLERKISKFDESVIIFWAEATLPLIQTTLSKIVSNIDDVLAVDFDTWIISPRYKFVIEFYHEGGINIGFW